LATISVCNKNNNKTFITSTTRHRYHRTVNIE
jgi:hypothetical protein